MKKIKMNEEVMEQLEKSEKDIEEGRVRSIDEFIEELKRENEEK